MYIQKVSTGNYNPIAVISLNLLVNEIQYRQITNYHGSYSRKTSGTKTDRLVRCKAKLCKNPNIR